MPKPEELREQARLYREESKTEVDPILSQALVSHALALAQLAEKIELDSTGERYAACCEASLPT